MKLTLAATVAAQFLVLAACSVDPGSTSAQRSLEHGVVAETPAPLRTDGLHDDLGLRPLAALADVVVSGTVEAVERGVRVGPDPNVSSAAVTLRVDELVRGEVEGPVKVVFLAGVHGKPFTIPGQSVPAVGSSGVWMLAEIGREFEFDGYYPAGPSGQILFDQEDRVVTGGTSGTGFARGQQEAAELGTRARVLERLRD